MFIVAGVASLVLFDSIEFFIVFIVMEIFIGGEI